MCTPRASQMDVSQITMNFFEIPIAEACRRNLKNYVPIT